ncbi:MAG: hypothetical protein HZB23_10685, partial [Deltaproteobacteria bacterium]|nr:hypothetical protein [Deltaproteobacteria bacterium]
MPRGFYNSSLDDYLEELIPGSQADYDRQTGALSEFTASPEFQAQKPSKKRESLGLFFDQWENPKGRPPAYDQDTMRRRRNSFIDANMEDTAPDRPGAGGFAKDVGAAVISGPVKGVETGLRALQAVTGGSDEQEGGGLLDRAVQSVSDFSYDTPAVQTSKQARTGLRRWVTEGVKSASQSLTTQGPATIAGAVIGGPVGAVGAFALSGGTVYGFSEFDSFMEEAHNQGIDKETAAGAAAQSALAEGGFEFATDLLEGVTAGVLKPLTRPGKAGLKLGVQSLLATRARQVAGRIAGTAATEMTGEALTAGVQAEVRRSVDMGDDRFWSAAIDVLGPTAVTGVIFGGLGAVIAHREKGRAARYLSDSTASEKDRLWAVDLVADAIKKESPVVSAAWKKSATEVVRKGEAVPLDEDFSGMGKPGARLNLLRGREPLYETKHFRVFPWSKKTKARKAATETAVDAAKEGLDDLLGSAVSDDGIPLPTGPMRGTGGAVTEIGKEAAGRREADRKAALRENSVARSVNDAAQLVQASRKAKTEAAVSSGDTTALLSAGQKAFIRSDVEDAEGWDGVLARFDGEEPTDVFARQVAEEMYGPMPVPAHEPIADAYEEPAWDGPVEESQEGETVGETPWNTLNDKYVYETPEFMRREQPVMEEYDPEPQDVESTEASGNQVIDGAVENPAPGREDSEDQPLVQPVIEEAPEPKALDAGKEKFDRLFEAYRRGSTVVDGVESPELAYILDNDGPQTIFFDTAEQLRDYFEGEGTDEVRADLEAFKKARATSGKKEAEPAPSEKETAKPDIDAELAWFAEHPDELSSVLDELAGEIEAKKAAREAEGKAVAEPAPEKEKAPGPSRAVQMLTGKKPAAQQTGSLADYGLNVTRATTKKGKPVWEVTGNTKTHMMELKSLGARWYGPRKAWSFYSDADPTNRILKALSGKETNPSEPAGQAASKPVSPAMQMLTGKKPAQAALQPVDLKGRDDLPDIAVDEEKSKALDKGDRVILVKDGKPWRRGTITGHESYRMQGVLGGQASEVRHIFTVESDNGVVVQAVGAERMIPDDPAIPVADVYRDVLEDGKYKTEDDLVRGVAFARQRAKSFRESAERARTLKNKAAHDRDSRWHAEEADKMAALLAAWRKKAEKVETKAGTKVAKDETKPATDETDEAESAGIPAEAWGKEGETYLPESDEPVKFRYAVAPIDRLNVSNNTDFSTNPAYPAELQNRDRKRETMKLKVLEIARRLVPAKLGASPSVTLGAPIVGPDMVVEAGNGRVMALGITYQSGGYGSISDPSAYQDWLVKNAGDFGLDPGAVLKTRRPVLVRVRKSRVKDRVEFTRLANDSEGAALSRSEQALSDAAMITDEDLLLFHPSESGDVGASANLGFLQRVAEKVGLNAAAGMVGADGSVTKSFLERVKNVVFVKAWGDQYLEAISEETDPDQKNLLNALMATAPAMVQAKVASPDLKGSRIDEKIIEAVSIVRKAKAKKLLVVDMVDQGRMFEETDYLPRDISALALFIDRNIRSGAKIRGVFSDIISAVRRAALDEKQEKILPVEPFDPDTVVADVVERAGSLSNGEGSPGLEADAVFPESAPDESKSAAPSPAPQSRAIAMMTGRKFVPKADKEEISGPKKSLAGFLGEAAKQGVTGVEESLTALYELAGGSRGGLKSFPGIGGFDEESYAAAKPHFEKSLAAFRAAGKSAKEFFSFLIVNLGAGIKPYIERFVSDKQSEAKGAANEQPDTGGDRETKDQGGVPGSSDLALGQLSGGDMGDVPGGPGKARQAGGAGGAAGDGELLPGEGTGRGRGSGDRVQVRGDSALRRPGPDGGETAEAPGAGQKKRDLGLGGPGSGKGHGGKQGVNHVIAPDDEIVVGGVEPRITANIEALRTALAVKAEGRPATPAEKKALAKFVGWGAFSQKVFDYRFTKFLDFKQKYPDETPEGFFGRGSVGLEKYLEWERKYGRALHPLLGGLMTQEEWNSARESTQNAHYTSREVIGAMWTLARRLGFSGGRVLEPAAGAGHFIGLAPRDIAEKSRFSAVEKDRLTGAVLEALYPASDVQVAPFEEARRMNGFDLVITNVPFAQKSSVYDASRPAYGGWSLHNYFFGKSLDAVRPGGLVIAITSAWTANAKSNMSVREFLHQRAAFVGGVRLPNTAFAANAGTEVVTDILVFQKRGDQLASVDNPSFLETVEIDIPEEGNTATINKYFAEHPEMVLGTHSMRGKMHARQADEKEYTVFPKEDAPFAEQLARAVGNFAPGIMEQGRQIEKGEIVNRRPASPGDQEGSLVEVDGRFYTVVKGEYAEPTITRGDAAKGTLREAEIFSDKEGGAKQARDKARKYMAIKRAFKDYIRLQLDPDAPDAAVESARKALKTHYDAFVRDHKRLHEGGSFLRKIDTEYVSVAALETAKVHKEEARAANGDKIFKDVVEYVPSECLSRRTMFPTRTPQNVESVGDAVTVSYAMTGELDTGYVAEVMGKTKDEIESLFWESPEVFSDPATGGWVSASEYLSGDVKAKFEQVRELAKDVTRYEKNALALERVLPVDLTIGQIAVRPGATWIDTDVYTDFGSEVLGLDDVSVSRLGSVNDERVTHVLTKGFGGDQVKSDSWEFTWSGGSLSADDFLRMSLNQQRPVCHDPVPYTDDSGKERVRQVLNKKATEGAVAKQKELVKAFNAWIAGHEKWGPNVAAQYNDKINRFVTKKVAAPAIEHYPGASHDVKLRDLQKRAVSRALKESVLLAYGVGTGKTNIFVTLAMEMRRLGTARKPLIVVQGSTVGQYASAFAQLYPQAKLLIPDDTQRGKGRQRVLSQIATGDWDAIVVPHDWFKAIPDSKERYKAMMEARIDEAENAVIAERERAGKKAPSVKELEGILNGYKKKLAKLMAREVAPGILNFEDLGIDALLIDEAHAFKRGEFFTRMPRIKGIDKSSSQRGDTLLLKSRWVQGKTGGKNVVLATGTPISNTIAELWTMMRYVRPDVLAQYHARSFDAFAAAFCDTTSDLEETATGQIKRVERFNDYTNMPELMAMFKAGTDIMLTANAGLDLPQIEGGKPEVKVIPRSDRLGMFIAGLRRVMQSWEKLSGQDKRDSSAVPVVINTLARKAAIDLRLVDPIGFADVKEGKLFHVADEIFDTWKKTEKDRLSQAVFLDVYQSGEGTPGYFNAYDEIRNLLVQKGVPRHEILLRSEAKTDKAANEMFDKIRSGEARVIIGHSESLGVGVNIQDRLVRVHHVDVNYTPMLFEQRNGRLVRFGNMNKIVKITNYVVDRSLDSVFYKILEKKQRFIDKILGSEEWSRTMTEPVSSEQLSFSEMSAAAAGNPLLWEQHDLAHKVNDLKVKKSLWEMGVSKAARMLAQTKREIEEAAPKIEKAVTAEKAYGAVFGQNEKGDIKAKTITFEGWELGRKEFLDLAAKFHAENRKKALEHFKNYTKRDFDDFKFQEAVLEKKILDSQKEETRSQYRDQLKALREKHSFPGETATFRIGGLFEIKVDALFLPTFTDKDGNEQKTIAGVNNLGKATVVFSGIPGAEKAYTREGMQYATAKGALEFVENREAAPVFGKDRRLQKRLENLQREKADYAKNAEIPFEEKGLLESAEKRLGEVNAALEEAGKNAPPDVEPDRKMMDAVMFGMRNALRSVTLDVLVAGDGQPGGEVAYYDKSDDELLAGLGEKPEEADDAEAAVAVGIASHLPVADFSTGDITGAFDGDAFAPWADISIREVRGFFPEQAGWSVGRSPDGAVFVKNADGVGFLVEAVDEIGADSVSFKASRGRELETGEVVKGKYRDGRITISKKAGDKWTFAHEATHGLEDLGLFTKDEIEALSATVKGLHKAGKLPFASAFDEAGKKDDALLGGKEDRARYVEWALAKRDFDRKTFVGQVLQRLADWADALVNLVTQTGLSVVRDLERGAVQARRPTVVEAAIGRNLSVDFSTVKPTGPSLTRDLEQNRSYANRLFEQKDVGVQQARTDVMRLQKRLQQLAGSRKFLGKKVVGFDEWKRNTDSDLLDMALMVWRDVKGDVGRIKKHRAWAKKQMMSPLTSRKQKLKIKDHLAILDRVESLTDSEKALADEIGRRFTNAFNVAKANKVIQSFADDYVRRIWSFPEKRKAEFSGAGSGYGFRVSTTAAKKRSLDSILDGWEAGYELGVKGLTNSWGTYAEELETILAHKDFLKNGYETRDAKGRRLFDTDSNRPGYAKLEAPGFSVWEWTGQSASAGAGPDDASALMVDTYGTRSFFVAPVRHVPEKWALFKFAGNERAYRIFDTEEEAKEFAAQKGWSKAFIQHRPTHEVADMWEKRHLYAPAELAEMINKMTAIDALFRQTPGASWLARFNASLKSWILLSSFFHHMAGTRSWALAVNHGWIAGRKMKDPMTGRVYKSAGVNPVSAYKAGFQKIMDNHPLITLGVKNGLTLGEVADWNESALRSMPGIVESLAESAGFERAVKVIRGIRRGRENFETSLFGRFFAGLKAEAFVNEYVHLLQERHDAHLKGKGPRPDADKVAEIAARLINEDFGGLHLGRMGRNPTLQKAARLLLLAPDWTESNFRMVTGLVPGLNEKISRAIGDIAPPPGMPARYRQFFTKVLVRSVATTMLLQMLINGWEDSWEFWKEQTDNWTNFKRFR